MEKIFIDIKNEFLQFFANILTPHIYVGIHSMYINAINIHKQLIENNVKSHPDVLKLFQLCLKDLPSLNSNAIETEVIRIKNSAKCSDWIEELLRSIIKSYIKIITINSTNDNYLNNYHEQIFFKDFIHKCYIECAHEFYNNPELFWHEFPILNLKKNQRICCEIIKLSIINTIKKMLPLKLLLIQYLNYNIIPNISNDNKQSESNNKSEQKKNIISDKSSSQKISDIEQNNYFNQFNPNKQYIDQKKIYNNEKKNIIQEKNIPQEKNLTNGRNVYNPLINNEKNKKSNINYYRNYNDEIESNENKLSSIKSNIGNNQKIINQKKILDDVFYQQIDEKNKLSSSSRNSDKPKNNDCTSDNKYSVKSLNLIKKNNNKENEENEIIYSVKMNEYMLDSD